MVGGGGGCNGGAIGLVSLRLSSSGSFFFRQKGDGDLVSIDIDI